MAEHRKYSLLKSKVMLKTFLIISLLLLHHPFKGQEEVWQHEYLYFIGLRYIHYHNCIECYFEPSEWQVPSTTMAVFTGLYMRRSHGFTLTTEYGQFNKTLYSTGVNTLDGQSALYNETLYFNKLKYINLSIGHTFGRQRLRFGLMFGLDYVFQARYRVEEKSSYYLNMDRPVIYQYPDKVPDGIYRYFGNSPNNSRSILPFISATLRYEFYNKVSIGITAEIPLVGRSENDHVYKTTRNDIYRLTFAYRFASTAKKSRKAKTK